MFVWSSKIGKFFAGTSKYETKGDNLSKTQTIIPDNKEFFWKKAKKKNETKHVDTQTAVQRRAPDHLSSHLWFVVSFYRIRIVVVWELTRKK
jgi:hypothetical protein